MGGNVNLEAPLPGSFSSHIPVGQTDPMHGSEDSREAMGRGLASVSLSAKGPSLCGYCDGGVGGGRGIVHAKSGLRAWP